MWFIENIFWYYNSKVHPHVASVIVYFGWMEHACLFWGWNCMFKKHKVCNYHMTDVFLPLFSRFRWVYKLHPLNGWERSISCSEVNLADFGFLVCLLWHLQLKELLLKKKIGNNLSKLLVQRLWGVRGWGEGKSGNVMCKFTIFFDSRFRILRDFRNLEHIRIVTGRQSAGVLGFQQNSYH